MTERTVLITGASDGIGASAARTLRTSGARVLLVGRSSEKTAQVAKALDAEYLLADFSDLAQVRRLADEVKSRVSALDVLANNAGGVFGTRAITTDGNEQTFQVNHLAPFLLTRLLMPELIAAGGSVVNTSSVASRIYGHIDMTDLGNAKNYRPTKAYGDAKLANILHVRGLQTRHGQQGVSTVAFHPGNVATNFASDTTSVIRFLYHTPLKRLALITADQGGANLVHFINGQPGITWQSGRYYDQQKLARKSNPQVHDDALVDKLWQASTALTEAFVD